VIAVVPARGGSKRIPRKNLVEFEGGPIIGIPLKTLLESDLFKEVIVSTDDEEIAGLARQLGASVPFLRPLSLATDHASTADVVVHAINDFVTRTAENPAAVIVAYPTSVFLAKSDVRRMVDILQDSDVDHVMTVGRYSTPIERAWRRLRDNRLVRVSPDKALARSQDLEPAYFDGAQAYASLPSAWVRIANGEEVPTALFELEPWRVWDIDTPDDLEMASILFRYGKTRLNDTDRTWSVETNQSGGGRSVEREQ